MVVPADAIEDITARSHTKVDLLDRRAGPPELVSVMDVATASPDDGPSANATRVVLVVVGDGMTLAPETIARATRLFEQVLLPRIAASDAVVLDGGTHAGIMAVVGQVRGRSAYPFHLIGVAPAACVENSGSAGDPSPTSLAGDPSKAAPEPHHGWLVTTPGTTWGAECPYLMQLASDLANRGPVTILVHGGGQVTRLDVEHAVAHRFRIVALSGTGRVADALAAARNGKGDASDMARWADGIVAAHPIEVVPITAIDFDADHWFGIAKTS
jgi:hypothetical protein